MRLPAGMLAVAIVATISTSFAQNAFAEDVDFDPQRAVEGRMVDQAADRAETCIHGMLLVNLYRGVRDRDTLVNAAVSHCEEQLAALLARINPKFSNRPGIHQLMIDSGNRQLDEIVARGE
jgi:hypothetical protein